MRGSFAAACRSSVCERSEFRKGAVRAGEPASRPYVRMSIAAPADLGRRSIPRAARRCATLTLRLFVCVPAEARGAMPNRSPTDRRARRRRVLDGEGRLAARRLRALARRAPAAARVLPADRLGRRRPLRRALLPPLLARLRGQPRVAVPPRPGHRRRRGRPRQPPAEPGPDLRRRRQRREHARRLARARARRDPAQGVAARHRSVRALGRLAVLVRAGAQRLSRRPANGPRAGTAALLQLRPLRRRAGAPRGVPPLRRRRDAPRLRRRGRRRAALPRHAPRARRQLARRPRAPTWSSRVATTSARRASPSSSWAARCLAAAADAWPATTAEQGATRTGFAPRGERPGV